MEQPPEQRSMPAHRSFLGDAGHFISSFRAIYLNNPDGRAFAFTAHRYICLLYTSPSPRDGLLSRMPSSA